MNFQQRILMDRFLAVPFAVVLNAFVRILGILLRRDHSIEPARTRKIVVCKLVGMGSILQATPLLRGIKKHFPKARIVFLTLKGNRDLVERLEGVDEVLCLDDSGALPMLWTTAKAVVAMAFGGVDHIFDLEIYSGFTCLLTVFSLARNRLGFYRHSNRFKRGIYTHLVYFNTRMPIRKIYLQLGGVAGLPMEGNDDLSIIRINDSERVAMREKLSTLGLKPEESYILINPNASDLLIERRWPAEYFIEVISQLTGIGHNVVLIGAKSETRYVASIVERIPETLRRKVFNTAGFLNMGELLALIENAQCALTNDTGPMHMLFALKCPVVCLNGPSDPVHYGMESDIIISLYAPVPCSPCVNEVDEPPCNGNNICMRRLTPEFVLCNVLKLLEQNQSISKKDIQGNESMRLPLVWKSEKGDILGIMTRNSN